MPKSVVVIGGGPAGLQAAADLGSMGMDVQLVERETFLGGNPIKSGYSTLFPGFVPAEEAMNELINRTKSFNNVTIHTGTELVKSSGEAGNFTVTVNGQNGEQDLQANAIVVATGFDHFNPGRDIKYGYDLFDDVLDAVEVERMLKDGKFVRPSTGDAPKRAGWILCVGSRDLHIGNTYCSTVCCRVAVAQAMEFKEMYPDGEAYVFYMDIRTYGLSEDMYWKSQLEYGVQYIKGRVSEINMGPDGRIIAKGEDTLVRGPFEVPFDIMVLMSGMEAGTGTRSVAKALGLPQNQHGFLEPKHAVINTTETPREGVFVAGAATGPKDIGVATAEGAAAASGVACYLSSVQVG